MSLPLTQRKWSDAARPLADGVRVDGRRLDTRSGHGSEPPPAAAVLPADLPPLPERWQLEFALGEATGDLLPPLPWEHWGAAPMVEEAAKPDARARGTLHTGRRVHGATFPWINALVTAVEAEEAEQAATAVEPAPSRRKPPWLRPSVPPWSHGRDKGSRRSGGAEKRRGFGTEPCRGPRRRGGFPLRGGLVAPPRRPPPLWREVTPT